MRSKNLGGGDNKKKIKMKMTGFKFNCPSLEDSEEGGAMKPSGYSRRRR
jgi:hypothetical protein